MRIAYINHGRFPTEKAYGNQIAQVCEALLRLGHSVSLLSPSFHNSILLSGKEYYGWSEDIQEMHLPHFDAFRAWYVPGKLGFLVSMQSYGRSVAAHIRSEHYDLLYIRSPLLLSRSINSGIPTVIELHDIPRLFQKHFVRLCNRCRLVVALTSPMQRKLVSMGVDPDKIVMEPDGVDLRRFAGSQTSAQAKVQWKLPESTPVIGYVGSLSTRETLSKGVEDIIVAAAELAKKNIPVTTWIVGGPDSSVKKLQTLAGGNAKIRFQGRIVSSMVSSALWACDVCIYPAPASSHAYFMRDTSPLKLFEYMASGKPMVCADIPPVRDIVDEQSALFYRPGDALMLASQIALVLSDPAAAKKRAAVASVIIKNHDWKIRMERILKAASSR